MVKHCFTLEKYFINNNNLLRSYNAMLVKYAASKIRCWLMPVKYGAGKNGTGNMFLIIFTKLPRALNSPFFTVCSSSKVSSERLVVDWNGTRR